MTSCKATLMTKKDNAVLGLPIGLLVILFISTAIIILFCLSLQNLSKDSQIHQIEQQIETILIESSTMFEYANEGAIVTLHVEFPPSMSYLVFGQLPRNGTTEPIDRTFDENTSNNYFYVMDDGTMRTFHSHVRFSDINMTQIVVFYPGAYDITLALQQKEGKSYVTMS